MFRRQCIGYCERYHEFIHLGLGVVCYFITSHIFPNYSSITLLLVALIGSLLPDVDHLFYLFGYGRFDTYAIKFKEQLKLGLNQAVKYCRQNHKNNCYIVSHNLISLFLALTVFCFALFFNNPILSVLSLSICFHFLFDIFEDILAKNKINPNWFLRFSRS